MAVELVLKFKTKITITGRSAVISTSSVARNVFMAGNHNTSRSNVCHKLRKSKSSYLMELKDVVIAKMFCP